MKGGFFMNFVYRAFLYVIRKRTKTLILFCVLTVIATLSLSGIAIKSATETAQLNVRQALGGVFTLNQNTSDASKWVNKEVAGFGTQSYYGGAPLTDELGKYIMENIQGIRGFNATYLNYVVPRNSAGEILSLLESESDGSGMDALMSGYGDFNATVSTYASTNTAFDSLFAGGYLKLVDGYHVTGADQNVVVMSKALAELNGLAIGDLIDLQMSEFKASAMGINAAETKKTVKIIGLFESTAKSTTSLSNWSMDNALYTTMDVVRHARPDMADEGYEHIHFYVNDPGELEKIIEEIKALSTIDPTDFVINVDSSDADAVMEPLANMNQLITMLIILVLVVGVVILYLILTSRIKERMHETGVLLALGISKVKIVGQYCVEVTLIAIIAFSLSIFSSNFVAQTIGNQLLDYTLTDATNQDTNEIQNYDGNYVLDSDTMAPQFEHNSELTKIKVSISTSTMLLLYCVGFIIVVISVTFAALPMLRLKPKEILAKMS